MMAGQKQEKMLQKRVPWRKEENNTEKKQKKVPQISGPASSKRMVPVQLRTKRENLAVEL